MIKPLITIQEKCRECGHGKVADDYGEELTCPKCKGTGYIIPKEYESYEIRKVSEIRSEWNKSVDISGDLYGLFCCKIDEHNLKEEDKLVITGCKN